MDATTLAKSLRKRVEPALTPQCGSPEAARRVLAATDREDLIWSYLTCSHCQQKLVTNFVPVIASTRDDEEFAEVATALLAAHRIEVHGEAVCDCAGEPVAAATLRDSLRYYLGDAQCGQKFGGGKTVWDAAGAWAARRWSRARNESHPSVEARQLSEAVRRALETCRGLDNWHWVFVFSPGSMNPLFECRKEWAALAVVDGKLARMAAGGGGLVFSVKVHFPGSPLAWLEFHELAVAPKGKPAAHTA